MGLCRKPCSFQYGTRVFHSRVCNSTSPSSILKSKIKFKRLDLLDY